MKTFYATLPISILAFSLLVDSWKLWTEAFIRLTELFKQDANFLRLFWFMFTELMTIGVSSRIAIGLTELFKLVLNFSRPLAVLTELTSLVISSRIPIRLTELFISIALFTSLNDSVHWYDNSRSLFTHSNGALWTVRAFALGISRLFWWCSLNW